MRNVFLFLSLAALAMTQYGCTKDFKELNTNPYALTNDQLKANNANVSAYFSTAQTYLVENQPWMTQLDNFFGDNFVGYVYPPSGFRSNQYPCTFFNQDGWQDGLWSFGYNNVMAPTEQIINNAKATVPATATSESQLAIARIIRVAGMHPLSDGWGPIIYTQYETQNADGSYNYDTQQETYTAFFADLDSAVSGLSAIVAAGTPSTFAGLDMIYQGKYESWIRAANSIRLRLALRLTRIDPATAKTQAQKALSEARGVITDNADNMHVFYNSASGGGFIQVSRDWTDERLGADFETILKGYNDPRLTLFFFPASDPTVGPVPTYKGIREGADISAKGDYVGYSAASTNLWGQNPSSWTGDLNVITAPEVDFMLAEIALRGWGTGSYTGTPQNYYEAGIKAHFDMYGLGAAYSTYIAGTSLPVDYVDPKKTAHNIAAVNLVPVKYDNTKSNEYQLQQIMTQKWIALFPNGKEAWSEWRRTGYPKVFTNYLNFSGGTISTTDGARRIFKFALSEYQNNAAGVQGAIGKLGGDDVGGTHVWWDPVNNKSNF